jgi:PAS domain S-box-containing protein
MDITKEKKTDTQLRRSDDRFRNFIETSDDFVFVIDRNGNFINVNKAGALYLEYMPLEMTGKHILEFIQEERKGDFARSFQEVLRSKGTASFEAGFVSKYGKNVVFEIKAHTLYDQHILDGVIGIGTNATERLTDKERHKELNNKLIEANRIISIERDRAKQKISILEELNRLKNDFVSNVSHELRTPLASIIGFSETIDSDRSMSDEMRIVFNQIILSEAKRLSNLINDVLDISRIEEGKISLSKSELNIIELVQPLVQQYKKRIEEKGIVFWTELPKQEVMIYGDRTRLYQVFEHLFSNAIKFTNEGRITILAQTLYREFEFIITDTGIGIPHKDIPFIFQKFYKVDRPGTELPGTGLGLSFVKQIIDLHHGFVTIQSEENKGTSIVIKLPIVKQEQADEHG